MKYSAITYISTSQHVILILVVILGNGGALPSLEFKNGEFYTITSVATGKVRDFLSATNKSYRSEKCK